MKPGSIVVIKPAPMYPQVAKFVKWTPVMDEKTPYMIRGIDECPVTHEYVATFEEGVIGWNTILNMEMGINLQILIELLPPEDRAEEIEDMMCVPVENTIANNLAKMHASLGKFLKRKLW